MKFLRFDDKNTQEDPQQRDKLPAFSSQREVHSSMFGFTEKLTLCSYVPKKGKAVILFLSLHHDASISDGQEKKSNLVLDYNSIKGAVDII